MEEEEGGLGRRRGLGFGARGWPGKGLYSGRALAGNATPPPCWPWLWKAEEGGRWI